MSISLALALRPAGCGGVDQAPGNVEIPDTTDGVPDLPDDTPIEDDPDWNVPPDPTPPPPPPPPEEPPPPPLVIKGHEIAMARLEANGVAYRNSHAGPKDKKTKAKLQEVALAEGYIAPLVINSDNFVGTTYDPASGKLKADKKVANVQTALGEIIIAVAAGDEIGGMVKGGKYWITLNDQAVAGPFDVPPELEEAAAGLIAKGAATDSWISTFVSVTMQKGYGRSYGFGYGSTV